MSPETKIIEVDGLAVHYLEAGPESGHGETIVFLHGAGGAPPACAAFVAMLAARHRLLIPSRPGFDDTPIGDCRNPADAAGVMAGFIRATADGPVHVVAQSAGAEVGSWLAVRHPGLVASLVLSAPSTFAERHSADTGPPTPEELDALLYGATPCWSAPPTGDERRRIARNARANMARARSRDGNRDLLPLLAEIAAPTLLLVGTGDRMIAADSVAPFQRHIPSCHRVFIHGAAHELPISAGPSWVGLVGDFIERGEEFVVNVGSRRPAP